LFASACASECESVNLSVWANTGGKEAAAELGQQQPDEALSNSVSIRGLSQAFTYLLSGGCGREAEVQTTKHHQAEEEA
jgi:hypothetical protein